MTIPSSDKTTTSTGHVADHNSITTELRAVVAAAADAALSPYDRAALAMEPVLYLPLDDPTAITDLGSGGHTVTTSGTLTATRAANGDGATQFDGASYVQVADANDLSPAVTSTFTVVAMIRPDVLQPSVLEGSGYVWWAGKGTTSNYEWSCRMYGKINSEQRPNRISGYAFNASGGLGVGSYFEDSFAASTWIHYAFTINITGAGTGSTQLYRDGVLRDTDDLATLGITMSNGTTPLRIGTRDFNSYFTGGIAKFAVFDRVLSATEIATLATLANTAPLVGAQSFVTTLGSSSASSSGTTLTVTATDGVPAGQTLIVRCAADYTSGNPTVTDSAANTWTVDRSSPTTGNTVRLVMASCRLATEIAAGGTVTVTWPSSIARRVVSVEVVDGLYSPLAVTTNATTNTSTTVGGSSPLTVTATESFVVGQAAFSANAAVTVTADATLTALTTVSSGGSDPVLRLIGAQASVHGAGDRSWHPTLSSSSLWVWQMAAYTAATR